MVVLAITCHLWFKRDRAGPKLTETSLITDATLWHDKNLPPYDNANIFTIYESLV